MAPAQSRRKVSYVIPPPTEPVPRLQLPPHGLPRHGSVLPLIRPSSSSEPTSPVSPRWAHNSRHRLGVACLALDTSTHLVGKSAPEGILYTGGRDGLVISWDLGLPMKHRSVRKDMAALATSGSRMSAGHWERMTGWGDDVIDEELEEGEDGPRSDGDILGEVKGSGRRRRRSVNTDAPIPFEHQWETDLDAFEPGKPSQFRQSTQVHTDWVNDILLCNHNQTVVSASSDGSVKAWNPHSSPLSDPTTVGIHQDYVRCLGQSREQKWIASGSFDRTIKLWDLGRTSSEPIVTLNAADSTGPKSSIYAMAVDPFGHTIVSGGPERVIRLWDPRAGKRIGKLVGHTDNIRSILVSENSRYLLTASADASIKLWSLASQRCLHTFTHHTDSVWSLHSSHPSLEVFYSGDRSGFVSKVDIEGCTDMSEGECVLLCQDTNDHGTVSEGVSKIIAVDDNLLWTASGNPSLKRWRVPQRRSVRAAALAVNEVSEDMGPPESPFVSASLKRKSGSIDTYRSRPKSMTADYPATASAPRVPRHSNSLGATLSTPDDSSTFAGHEGEATWYGIPFESLVRLTSPHDPFSSFSPIGRGRDADVATLYSAASIVSVPGPRTSLARSPLQSVFPNSQMTHTPSSSQSHGTNRESSPVQSIDLVTSPRADETLHPAHNARVEYEEREVVADAVPLQSTPDEIIEGEHGLIRAIILNDRIHALTVDTASSVAIWDLVRGVCLGKFPCSDVAAASLNGSTRTGPGSASAASGSGSGGGASSGRERSPREALEIVRERVEGEAVVMPWSTVDTKIGVLSVHLTERCFEAEVYADEVNWGEKGGGEEHRLNIGKWVLRNLFLGFIREQQRAYARRVRGHDAGVHPMQRTSHSNHVHDPDSIPGTPRRRSSTSTTSSISRRLSYPPSHASIVSSPTLIPAVSPIITSSASASPLKPALSPLITPKIPLHHNHHSALTPIAQSPGSEITPGPGVTVTSPTGRHSRAYTDTSATPLPTHPHAGDYFSMTVRRPSVSSGSQTHSQTQLMSTSASDEHVSWGPGVPNPGHATAPAGGGTTAVTIPKESSRDKEKDRDVNQPLTPNKDGGGLMGRLKSLGKRRPASEHGNREAKVINAELAAAKEATESVPPVSTTQSPVQTLLAGTITPPTSAEAPTLPLNGSIQIFIAEEGPPGWTVTYRGTVSSTGADVHTLEEALPMWLLEYLLVNKAPVVPITKIGFVLLPYQSKEPDAEQLPELLNTSQSKLTASRFLRVRKLTSHVQDKIDKMANHLNTPSPTARISPRSSSDTHHSSSSNGNTLKDRERERSHDSGRPRPEETWEILCNETVLPLDMTLAAVKQFVWKQSGELTMHYRRRRA